MSRCHCVLRLTFLHARFGTRQPACVKQIPHQLDLDLAWLVPHLILLAGVRMKTRREIIEIVLLSLAGILFLSALLAGEQRRGMGSMAGMGHRHREDMLTIHALFADHKKIERKVTKLANGIETITESDDATVAARIVEHAYAMKERLEKNDPVHVGDPLFAALIANTSKIQMEIVKTSSGVTVRETSDDAEIVKLIQAHADLVTKFVDKGMSTMHRCHAIP